MDERELRELSPAVIGALLRRGVNFAAAEAAAAAATAAAREQEADPPPDEDGRLAWLTALAWRSFLDAAGEPGTASHRSRRNPSTGTRSCGCS